MENPAPISPASIVPPSTHTVTDRISELQQEFDDVDSVDSLDVYPHQVGGHHIFVKHPTHPELIVKPFIAKEVQFYKDAQNSLSLMPVISKYHGCIRLNSDGGTTRHHGARSCVSMF